MRDPLIDPQAGDVVIAAMEKQTVERRVVRREHNNVWYTSSTRNGEHVCWLTTWQAWCSKRKAVSLKEQPRSPH